MDSKLIEQIIIEETTKLITEAFGGNALNQNATYMSDKFMADLNVFFTGERHEAMDARNQLKSEFGVFGNYVFTNLMHKSQLTDGGQSLTAFYNADGQGPIGDFVFDAFKKVLSLVRPFTESRIIDIIGAPGLYGWLVELDTGHILKFFQKGVGDYTAGEGGGSGEIKWYANMKDRAFSGKGSRSELMIYDTDVIEIPFPPPIDGVTLNYVEMSKVLPWEDYIHYLRKTVKKNSPQEMILRDLRSISFFSINGVLIQLYKLLKDSDLPNTLKEYLKLCNIASYYSPRMKHTLKLSPEYKDMFRLADIDYYSSMLRDLRESFTGFHHKLFFRYIRGIYETYESGAVGRDLHEGNFGVTFENPMDPHFVFFDP